LLQTAAMTRAVFQHATPLLSIRAPLIAGLGAAGLFALSIGGIALFGDIDMTPPFARGDVEPEAQIAAHVPDGIRDDSHGASDTIRFVEPEGEHEASLTGVDEGFTPAAAAGHGSDPADAETRHAATTAAAAGNPNALAPAPRQGLTEPGPGGYLPVIGADGTRPSRAYARPFHGDPNIPMLGVVVGGMGMNPRVTQAAIDDLPPEIALSFAVYADDLQMWIDRARAAGHEVLIEAPMEPFDYPNNDPGPHTLLADGSIAENERRLAWVLSRTTGYFGVTNYLGARFSASESALTEVLRSLEERGVAFLHDGAGRRRTIETAANAADIVYAIADRILDENPTPDSIDSRLLALEALALQDGSALGTGFAYPATVEQVGDWAENLTARGYQLAPPSAVMARRRFEARLEAEAAALAAASAPARSAPRERAPAQDEPAGGSGHP
jgi:polysaccharide deacetylase 2 family uncharacterized protein YibQ